MKTMKTLKQQITTVVSLALVVMAIAVCAPNQSLANGKGRPTNTNPRQRNTVTQPVTQPVTQTRGQVKSNEPVSKGKYGPKKPSGVWVWDASTGGYIWM